jgi:deazaflavin-dependent oxidoreductase (nitroreductase family)
MSRPRAPSATVQDVGMAPPPRIRVLRRFTTFVFNPVSRLFAGRLPGFGIIEYQGRKTGRTYRTPLNVFRDGDDWIVALTYGSDVQWVKNVVAAGGCKLTVRSRTTSLVDPQVFVDPTRRLMPFPVRQFLGLMRVSEFMRMSPVPRTDGRAVIRR